MNLCRARRFLHLFLGGVRHGIGNVVEDGAFEDHRFLRHHPGVRVQAAQREVAHVMPIERDLPPLHVPQAHEQAGDGGFPAAGMPDQRRHLPGGQMQIEAGEERMAFLIGEIDVLQA